MNNTSLVINCDKRYLSVLLTIQLVITAGLAIVIMDTMFTIIAIVFTLGFLISWFVKTKLWKYKIDNTKIHTKKIFSSQMDLHIPLERISGFNTEEGIFEAIFNVETIVISTSSSQSDQVTIKWPYVNTNTNVTEYLENAIQMSK